MSPRNIPTRNVRLSQGFEARTAPLATGRDVRAVPVTLEPPPLRIRAVTRPTTVPVSKSPLGPEAAQIHRIRFSKPVIPKVRPVQIHHRKTVGGHRVRLEAARKIETSYSPMLDKKPITLEMLDLKHVPYPVISEIIRTLAEKGGVSYSQVKLVGIFDPIPTELVQSMSIDSFAGRLRLNLRRKSKKGKPGCVRIAYGRLRTDDKIVQCVLPLN